MHIIHVSGNVGKDVDLRKTQTGTPVLAFSIASENRGETTWFKCAIFGKRAEALQNHIKKGTGLHVSGVVKADAYIPNAGGDPKASMEIYVDQLGFVGGAKSNTETPPADKPEPGGADLDDGHPF